MSAAAVVRLAEPLQLAVGDVHRLDFGEQLLANAGLAEASARRACRLDATRH